jgi:hypothetical protein
MSAINGDKARFNRQRKQKLAKRERYRLLREKLTAPAKREINRAGEAAVRPRPVTTAVRIWLRCEPLFR